MTLPRKHLHTLPSGPALPDATANEEGFPFLLETTSGASITRTLFQVQGGVWAGVAVAAPPATEVTGSYTLVLGDAGKTVDVTSSSAATVTIPASTAVAFPIGTVVTVVALGSGTVTVAPDTGVTLHGLAGHTAISGQYGEVAVRQTDTDTWVLTGDLA